MEFAAILPAELIKRIAEQLSAMRKFDSMRSTTAVPMIRAFARFTTRRPSLRAN
jgi:hypothetical protein